MPPIVQVHCECSPLVARRRFEERVQRGERHPVHRLSDAGDRWAHLGRPLDLPGALLRVDTDAAVDVGALADQVRGCLDSLT